MILEALFFILELFFGFLYPLNRTIESLVNPESKQQRSSVAWMHYWFSYTLHHFTLFAVFGLLPYIGGILRVAVILFLAIPRFGGVEMMQKKMIDSGLIDSVKESITGKLEFVVKKVKTLVNSGDSEANAK